MSEGEGEEKVSAEQLDAPHAFPASILKVARTKLTYTKIKTLNRLCFSPSSKSQI
jgi:hypothetical protein